MGKSTGWVKQHRKEIHSEIFGMAPLYYKVWQWLKMSVDRKTGALTTSIGLIAQGVEWMERGVWKTPNRRTIVRILDWMVSRNMITRQSNATCTTLTLINWQAYQSRESTEVTVSAQASALPSALPSAYMTRSTTEVQERNNTSTTQAKEVHREAQPPSGSVEGVVSFSERSERKVLKGGKPVDPPPGNGQWSAEASKLASWINAEVQRVLPWPPEAYRKLDTFLKVHGAQAIQDAVVVNIERIQKAATLNYLWPILSGLEQKKADNSCPKCGRYPYGWGDRDTRQTWLKASSPTGKGIRVIFKCPDCGHVEKPGYEFLGEDDKNGRWIVRRVEEREQGTRSIGGVMGDVLAKARRA